MQSKQDQTADATTSASTTATLDMVKQVQATQLAEINNTRCIQIQKHLDFQAIGGRENIEESVLTVVTTFPNGVLNEHLKGVFPEEQLAAARTSLKAKGVIEQSGKRGDDVTLKPVLAAK